jgi:hypothetical protein
MKNWTDSLHYLKTSLDSALLNAFRVISKQTLSLVMLAFLLGVNYTVAVGQFKNNHTVFTLNQEIKESRQPSKSLINQQIGYALSEIPSDTVPSPSKVLYQSLMVPGWGQVTNRQIWKVPVIYGFLLALPFTPYMQMSATMDTKQLIITHSPKIPISDLVLHPPTSQQVNLLSCIERPEIRSETDGICQSWGLY